MPGYRLGPEDLKVPSSIPGAPPTLLRQPSGQRQRIPGGHGKQGQRAMQAAGRLRNEEGTAHRQPKIPSIFLTGMIILIPLISSP